MYSRANPNDNNEDGLTRSFISQFLQRNIPVRRHIPTPAPEIDNPTLDCAGMVNRIQYPLAILEDGVNGFEVKNWNGALADLTGVSEAQMVG